MYTGTESHWCRTKGSCFLIENPVLYKYWIADGCYCIYGHFIAEKNVSGKIYWQIIHGEIFAMKILIVGSSGMLGADCKEGGSSEAADITMSSCQ